MVDHIANDVGGFKAIGQLDISATAKYVGSVIIATGITAATEIVAITGLPRSTVYRALAEFFASDGGSLISPTSGTAPCITRPTSENPTCLTDENVTENSVSLVPPVGQRLACADIDSRATKELPSEVLCYEDTNTPSSVPPKPKQLPSAKPRASAQRGPRLSPDWTLPEDWRQWSLMNFAHASETMIAAEADQFRDFWISKTGNSATKLDWQATWRN